MWKLGVAAAVGAVSLDDDEKTLSVVELQQWALETNLFLDFGQKLAAGLFYLP